MSNSAQYPSQIEDMTGQRPAKRAKVDGDLGPSQGIGETTKDFNGNTNLDDDDIDDTYGLETSKHAPRISDLYLDTVRWLFQPSLSSPHLRYS